MLVSAVAEVDDRLIAEWDRSQNRTAAPLFEHGIGPSLILFNQKTACLTMATSRATVSPASISSPTTKASISSPTSPTSRWSADYPAAKILFPITSTQRILKALGSLKESIESTKSKKPRKIVPRKAITQAIVNLRNMLQQKMKILPMSENRTEDPHYYLELFLELAKHVKGSDGIKYLKQTIEIIATLFTKIEDLESKLQLCGTDIDTFEQSVSEVKQADDSASCASIWGHEELIGKFMNKKELGGERKEVLCLVRFYLETFLGNQNYCTEYRVYPPVTLWNAALQYNNEVNEGRDEQKKALEAIIDVGNTASHIKWWEQSDKEKMIEQAQVAIDQLPDFKAFLMNPNTYQELAHT